MKYKKLLFITIFFVIASISSSLIYWYYFTGQENVIVITDEDDEYKKRPDDPGGIVLANSSSLIYEKLRKNIVKEKNVHILPEPEPPLKIDFKEKNIDSIDNKPVKMSKRSGHFMTIGDVINEVGKDIVRFIMLTRRNDMTLDFDFSKVVEQSKDNPVFYVQYAYVRTRSILANAKENATSAYDKFMIDEFDLSLLSSEEEIQLIKLLALWPKVLASAAKNFEPHKIAYYLIDVASRFHSIWNLGKENNEYRFVTNNDELTAARLALSEAIKKIIANGFEIIGITMVEKM